MFMMLHLQEGFSPKQDNRVMISSTGGASVADWFVSPCLDVHWCYVKVEPLL